MPVEFLSDDQVAAYERFVGRTVRQLREGAGGAIALNLDLDLDLDQCLT